MRGTAWPLLPWGPSRQTGRSAVTARVRGRGLSARPGLGPGADDSSRSGLRGTPAGQTRAGGAWGAGLGSLLCGDGETEGSGRRPE